MLMVGFDGLAVGDELRDYIATGPPAGVVLFGRNVSTTKQVAALTREIRALWPQDSPAPLFAVDQEGGRVRRLRGPATPEVSPWPSMRELAAAADVEATRRIAEVSGAQLASLGFNLNFAPVLDIDSNPDNPVIGARAFGPDGESVARLALAYAQGLQARGVLACGKHFPGHGDTDLDSHLALPRIAHDLQRLQALELVPFRHAVASQTLHCFMTAHIVFEALDATTPATLSPHVIPRLLRDELGFDGVVVSDDLDMAAIQDHYSPEEVAAGGIAADVDLFLVCHNLPKARAIREALAGVEPSRLARSTERLQNLRRRARDNAARPWSGDLPMRAEGRAIAQTFGWPTEDPQSVA